MSTLVFFISQSVRVELMSYMFTNDDSMLLQLMYNDAKAILLYVKALQL